MDHHSVSLVAPTKKIESGAGAKGTQTPLPTVGRAGDLSFFFSQVSPDARRHDCPCKQLSVSAVP